MSITYKKIDEDTVKKITTTESELEVADLEAEIAKLKDQIAALPKEKTVPDEEAMEYFNMTMADPVIKKRLEDDLAAKEAELVEVKDALKAKAVEGIER